jgi:hypothetical protein
MCFLGFGHDCPFSDTLDSIQNAGNWLYNHPLTIAGAAGVGIAATTACVFGGCEVAATADGVGALAELTADVVGTDAAVAGSEGLADAGVEGAADTVEEAGAPSVEGDEGVDLESYSEGQGHHIPAKIAFSDGDGGWVEGYNPDDALAIPRDTLEELDLSHSAITGLQHTLYSQFLATGEDLTWDSMSSIESQALQLNGEGLSAEAADATVQNAVSVLQESGVDGPARIPWGPR